MERHKIIKQVKALLLHLVIKVTLEVICLCLARFYQQPSMSCFCIVKYMTMSTVVCPQGSGQSPPAPASPPSTSLRKVLSCPVHVPITLRGAEGAKAAESESLKGPHLVKGILSKVQKKS